MQRKPLSSYHIILYKTSVFLRRTWRHCLWYCDGKNYAKNQLKVPLPYRIKKHQSVLLKKLGESDMQLQRNKVTNLKIAIETIDGLIIKPGEIFSFCRRVGKPTAKRGFLEGMEISFGQPQAGIGGGICQISNLIHWLVIHSPLTVTERYHHSYDPFPDDGRVLPFGSGATVFYNYRDYQFKNNTDHTFQIRLWFSEKCLEGELRCSDDLPYRYHVIEENHAFIREENGLYFRRNEIWRICNAKGPRGRKISKELVTKNYARVAYVPQGFEDPIPSDSSVA